MAEKQWPADKVERRPVGELVPYARNARTHSPELVDQLGASIKEWGWTTAVLVDETGQIIAGHGRILAAQKLGIKTVPVMTATGYEPFSGSGTTIMAGELTGRSIHAIELSPAYVDVAIKRWQDFTGKKATHAETGKSFDEMSDDRYSPAQNSAQSYDVAVKEIRKRKKAEAAE